MLRYLLYTCVLTLSLGGFADINGSSLLQTPVFSSNLPLIIINTYGQSIVDDPKITAYMGIIDNGPGSINTSTDPFNDYDGYIGIELRGNSTQSFPKKPYAFETRYATGENLNASLLGMPEENDWILRASYIDHTFIRNSLASYMSAQTGRWASRTRHVEVIINNEYQGIYILMEKIKQDNNRVDIAKLNPTDIVGEEITGGYIWEVSGFSEDFGSSRTMKDPDIEDMAPEQIDYIRNVDDAFRTKMASGSATYADPNTGYVEHIKVESFIYEMIVQEAMRNSDAYGWSGYFHKDKNELIEAGPVWDFDQSAGNSSYPDNGVTGLWLASHSGTNNTPFFWPLLMEDPFFKYSLKLRWEELRAGKFSDQNLTHFIDSIAGELSEAQVREFEKWPVLGQNIFRETTGYVGRDSYQKEVDYLKDFLLVRWAWIDSQLQNVSKPVGYPEIIVNVPDTVKMSGMDTTVNMVLAEYFTYPYTTALDYKIESTSAGIVNPDVKRDSTLEIQPLIAGTETVTLSCKDTYGNKVYTDIIVEVEVNEQTLSVLEENQPKQVEVYPNPSNGFLQVKLIDNTFQFSMLTIYDLAGEMVGSMDFSQKNFTGTYDCSNLPDGIYVIRFQTESGKFITSKFLLRK